MNIIITNLWLIRVEEDKILNMQKEAVLMNKNFRKTKFLDETNSLVIQLKAMQNLSDNESRRRFSWKKKQPNFELDRR